MKGKTPSHIRGSALQTGPLLGRRYDLPSLASFRENAPRLKALNKHWKLYHGEDGWFASGRLGQVCEYGVGKLGFTVTSSRMINKVLLPVKIEQPTFVRLTSPVLIRSIRHCPNRKISGPGLICFSPSVPACQK